MEFLVEFEVEVPVGTPDAEVEQHQVAESAAAAKLAASGHRPPGRNRPRRHPLHAQDGRRHSALRPITPRLEWLNKGVFISVGARHRGVIYETYVVG